MSLRSLNSVATRNLSRRRGRYVLTASGTALGVAVLFAVQVMSGATTHALDRAIHGGAGKDDVFVSPVGTFDGVLPADTFARVRALPDVAVAQQGMGFRSALSKPGVQPKLHGRQNIAFVTGVDLAVDRTIRDYQLRSGRLFTPGADEVIVAHHMAKKVGLTTGDTVLVAAPSGQVPLKVVGVLADAGVGNADEGQIVLTSNPVAQRLAGKGDANNGIDIVLRDGVDVDKWVRAERLALGDNVALTKASDADAGFRSFVAAINGALTGASAIALFVGGFLIFLTFSLAVQERTRMYGTMRALGGLPRQVRRVVVTEAIVLGFASSIVGLFIGYGLAALSLGLVGTLLGLVLPGLGLPVGSAIIAVIVGVIVSAVAAWLPARRAARLSPVVAMREGGVRDEKAGRPILGSAFVAVGMVLLLTLRNSTVRIAPTLLVLLGAVLLVPVVLGPIARVLGVLTSRLARGVGEIAIMHLVKQRSRSAYTLALVMTVLAMTFAIGTTNVSMSHTVDKVIERQAAGAIQVGAPGALDPGVERELAAIPGVGHTAPIWFGQIDIDEPHAMSQDFFTMIDPATYFDVASLPWLQGDDAIGRREFAAGHGIVLPEQTAARLDVKRGGSVRVRTTSGIQAFRVIGTFGQIGNTFGPIVGRADAALFGAGRPNGFLLTAKPGVSRNALANTIKRQLVAKYSVQVQTSDDIRSAAHAQLQGFFALAYALLFVAALVGILGLANTMVVSVLARTREIGMLRSAGTLRRQARAMVLVEATTLALVAYLIALPLGWLLSTGLVVSQRAYLGTITYSFAWFLVPVLILVAVLVAAIASLVPARRIGRLQIVEALRFD